MKLHSLSPLKYIEDMVSDRSAAMLLAGPTPDAHHCSKLENQRRGCALLTKDTKEREPVFKRDKAGPGESAEEVWCSVHNTTT